MDKEKKQPYTYAWFLFEILSEEIPPENQRIGIEVLCELFAKYCKEYFIDINDVKLFHTSQRISIKCSLKIEQKEKITHVRGVRIGVDQEVLDAFLKAQKNQNYTQIELENGKYHGLEYREIINKTYKKVKENLAKICLQVLNNFDWKDTTMTWKSYLPKWIRPIRSILCIIDYSDVLFEFAGVKSSNYTHGHKILTRWKKIYINHPSEYEEKLYKEGNVIVDQNIRLAKICGFYGVKR